MQFLFYLIFIIIFYSNVNGQTTITTVLASNQSQIELKSNGAVVLDKKASSCLLNQHEHPINLTANCKEVIFPLRFENYSDFTAAVDFDSKTCAGQIELNITINECLITLSKTDIPGGSVVVVNGETHNLIPGKRVVLTLGEERLSIQGASRQFQMKSTCKLGDKNSDVQLETHIQNSNPECKALISLDSSAKFYNTPSLWQVIKNNLTFFIIALAIILLCIILLILMLCLWRLNHLPGTRLVTPRSGRYAPKSIEESFPSAYPVHFKPHAEPVTRSSQTIDIQPAVTVERYEPDEQNLKL